MSEEWTKDALCRKTKGIDFFADDTSGINLAKALCSKCNVAAECFQQSILAEEIYGIWGGLSQRERRKYHRTYSKNIEINLAKEIVIKHGNKRIK